MSMIKMSSFIDRGQKEIAAGNTQKAMILVTHGLQHYSDRVLKGIQPYAKSDACLVVLVLRHIANEIERLNPGTKEAAEAMEKCINFPPLEEIEKIRKPNRK